jgi:hypothetical protein
MVAVVISYEGTHADKRYFNTVYKHYRQALKRLQKETTEAEQAARILGKREAELQKIHHFRQKSYEMFVQEITGIQEWSEWLVASYRAANMRVRDSIPACFLDEPKIPELPVELLTLDWTCQESEMNNEQIDK